MFKLAFIKKVLKNLFVFLATKYAAELIVKIVLDALEKQAAKTKTKIDDEFVAKLRQDEAELIKILSGK